MQPNRRSRWIERATLGPALRRSPAVAVHLAGDRAGSAGALPARAATHRSSRRSASRRDLEAARLSRPATTLPATRLRARRRHARAAQEPAPTRRRLSRAARGAAGRAPAGGRRQARLGRRRDDRRARRARRPLLRLGYVSDADLAELYRRCGVFCYPSLGEGFGLPVLEAMAAGAPVVTSNFSSLPEVGGDAVEYAEPTSVESIAARARARPVLARSAAPTCACAAANERAASRGTAPPRSHSRRSSGSQDETFGSVAS